MGRTAVGYVATADLANTYVAHHAIVLALPFVLPVFLVVGMVAVVAWRDRHRPDEADEETLLGANPDVAEADAVDPVSCTQQDGATG
jgi:hypothetical protein